MSVPHGIDRSGAAAGSGAQGMSGSLNDLADPGADRIVFWDDSVGDLQWLSLDTGLSFSNAVLTLSATLQALHGLTPSDGGFIVGNGSTWTVESGATARASLGIADAENPTDIGHIIIGETSGNPESVRFPHRASPLINGKLALSVSASILTVAIKGLDGNDPSPSNPVFVRIAQGNPFDGTYAVRKITAALSTTVSSGSTLGHSNGVASAVYVYALDDSGTIKLAVSSKFFGYDAVASATAEGGAGGADDRSTLYATSAATSANISCLARWQSTQTSAGVWAATTGTIQLAPFPYKAPTVNVTSSSGGVTTYTKPWDALCITAEVQAPGGGGGGVSAGVAAGVVAASGGGGGYSKKTLAADLVAPTETVTVGSNGTAGSATAHGGAGGTTSFGSHCSATGGGGGERVTTGQTDPGAGGVGSGGDINSAGGAGVGSTTGAASAGGPGGNSVLGGGAKVSSTNGAVGAAGGSYGGGGSGAKGSGAAAFVGGVGGLGAVIITEHYA
jgi:hypothetical protein